jgi:hypothetical protein
MNLKVRLVCSNMTMASGFLENRPLPAFLITAALLPETIGLHQLQKVSRMSHRLYVHLVCDYGAPLLVLYI